MNKFDLKLKDFESNIEITTNELINKIKTFFAINNIKGAVIGMSGGIDCSIVARLLQKADIDTILVTMPYGDNMELAGDNKDANSLIEKFGFEYMNVDITSTVNTLLSSMTVDKSNTKTYGLKGLVGKITGREIVLEKIAIDNIKPRVRMTTLYTLAQSLSYLVVGTGNLSEITMGYFTKWGDGASDFNPIAHLTKSEIRIMAKYLQLPENIITKVPSANLWKGQTDEDEMGISYYELDRYILTNEGSTDAIFKVETANRKNKHKLIPITTFN